MTGGMIHVLRVRAWGSNSTRIVERKKGHTVPTFLSKHKIEVLLRAI
jgi:hypothetical protein